MAIGPYIFNELYIREGFPMKRVLNQLRAIHEDEDGMEAIQVVMIVAIAALALVAFFVVGKKVMEGMRTSSDDVMKQKF